MAENESESMSQSGEESEETNQDGGAKDEEFLPGFASLEAYSKVRAIIRLITPICRIIMIHQPMNNLFVACM